MRRTLSIVIGLTIAAAVASAAHGQQPSPIQRIIAQEDHKGVALRHLPGTQPAFDGRSPDTVDAARAAHAAAPQPHVTQPEAGPWYTPAELKALITHSNGLDQSGSVADGRSPDTRDAAFTAHTTPAAIVVTVGDGGFDWGDAGIGGVAVFALALLAAGGVALVREGRRQKAHG
jgi:hypothetical protein